jgi:hypothetical protein
MLSPVQKEHPMQAKTKTNWRLSVFLSLFLGATIIVASCPVAFALKPKAQIAPGSLADDSILVLLAPNADCAKAKGALLNEAQATTIKEMHCNPANFSVVHVQPQAGRREETLSKILAMKTSHPEILSAQRNYVVVPAQQSVVPPNDPLLAAQWPLSAQGWLAAQATYYGSQSHRAYLTIMGDGFTPVANELGGANIVEYDCTGATVQPTSGWNPSSGEGCVDESITGCITGNGIDIAGELGFQQSVPGFITALMIVPQGQSFGSVAAMYQALVWAINNQAARGGPGAITCSYGFVFPGPPLWTDPGIESLAAAAYSQGDLVLFSTGDTTGTYPVSDLTGYHSAPVQGSDNGNNLMTIFNLLTNDPRSAPGSAQLAIIDGLPNGGFGGTSFSDQHWGAMIAMLQSVVPSLTAVQADQILINTGTPCANASQFWPVVVPNLNAAINSAIPPPSQPPPPPPGHGHGSNGSHGHGSNGSHGHGSNGSHGSHGSHGFHDHNGDFQFKLEHERDKLLQHEEQLKNALRNHGF